MNNLNYLKKAKRKFLNEPGLDDLNIRIRAEEFAFMKQATKFTLPSGGLYMENDDLPSTTKLPYADVLLEFAVEDDTLNPNATVGMMVYASSDGTQHIEIKTYYVNRRGEWSDCGCYGYIPEMPTNENDNLEDFLEVVEVSAGVDEEDKELCRYSTRCVMNFLLFLDMSNINVVKNAVKPEKGDRLSALTYDTYHVLKLRHHKTGVVSDLTCERVSRSPRQHLRRGHLRRKRFSEDKIWINPVIVNKGWKAKVTKDYELVAA